MSFSLLLRSFWSLGHNLKAIVAGGEQGGGRKVGEGGMDL